MQALIDIDATLAKIHNADTKIENSEAAVLADRLLRGVGTRLGHSAKVAEHVDRVGHMAEGPWQSAMGDAAWLHDIGYNGRIIRTGFHPLDAARWLRHRDWPLEICRLVAWHTAASAEGALRGLDQELADEFDPPPPLAAAALAWADLTSSPDGASWSVARRLADILRRYPPDSIVHRAIVEALPALLDAAREVESRLAPRTGGA